MITEALNPIDRLLAERACERVIVDFVHKLDFGDPGDVADLFTDGGFWEWPEGDRRIEGRDALRSYFVSRPSDRLSRRICTNILVTVTSESTAIATTYFTTYRVDGHTGSGFAPQRPPTQVGHYTDTFLKVEGDWLLGSRSLHLAFAGPTERLEAEAED